MASRRPGGTIDLVKVTFLEGCWSVACIFTDMVLCERTMGPAG
jgi:hypothetical protein